MLENKRTRAHLLLLLTAIIWGSAFVFQKFATEELSGWFITAARFSIAAVVLWVITYKNGADWIRGICLAVSSQA